MKPVLLFLGNLGMQELLLIVMAAGLLFGGQKIPGLMKGLGRNVRSLKKSLEGLSPEEENVSSAAAEPDAGKDGRKILSVSEGEKR